MKQNLSLSRALHIKALKYGVYFTTRDAPASNHRLKHNVPWPIMSKDDRFEKARRLAELTDSGRGYIRGAIKHVEPDSAREMHEARVAQLHIELGAKHMTSEQLNALLDFYTGDMGKSILTAQEQIRMEMSSILASSISNSTAKRVIVPKSKQSGDDDI